MSPALAEDARTKLAVWRAAGDRIVFTNGVYDLLHRGLLEVLDVAARWATGSSSASTATRASGA